MAKYAKFISDTQIKYAQRTLKEPDFICFNFSSASPEILNSRGYYQVIETNSIEDVQDETHYARPTYTFDNEQIFCTYVAEEITEEQE